VQGSEREFIIVDLTVTDDLGFLSLTNRINVALSRARSGLLVIGNYTALERSSSSLAHPNAILFLAIMCLECVKTGGK